MNYLERYTNGEHEQVWDDLLALGAAMREKEVYPDALAVARETMRRVRQNIELLINRLVQIGFILAMIIVSNLPSVSNILQKIGDHTSKCSPGHVNSLLCFSLQSSVRRKELNVETSQIHFCSTNQKDLKEVKRLLKQRMRLSFLPWPPILMRLSNS